ncbi:hypothetical protein SB00610_05312 [Klebsiella quasipneumoniae subsp. similipneumoniae]|nr:hypothetical protein SB00610_05312 [Klebsiella quasipneumoniae subsp. similipneumoniae]
MIETDHIGLVKRRQPVDANADTAPERRFAAPGVFDAKAIEHFLEQAVFAKNQYMARIEQGDHQQRTVAAPGKTRLQARHQRLKLRQVVLSLLCFAQQVSHLQQRALSHRQRTFAIAEGKSAAGGDTRQLLRRRAVACRPDDK